MVLGASELLGGGEVRRAWTRVHQRVKLTMSDPQPNYEIAGEYLESEKTDLFIFSGRITRAASTIASTRRLKQSPITRPSRCS